MSRGWFLIAGVFMLGLPCTVTLRADECTPPSNGPDAVVMDIVGTQYWATISGVSAFSFGGDMLNKGNAPLAWNGQVGIAQNAYRLKDNRFEQIGMSWVKVVAIAATDSTYCSCIPSAGALLGIGCSDVYEATVNGEQSFLGPRSTVDAFAGTVPTLGGTGANAIERRIQVQVSDIDPAFNPGAMYFAELQLVSTTDNNAGNSLNNCSVEARTVTLISGTWRFVSSGSTTPKTPAIFGWNEIDPSVNVLPVDIPSEGRFYVASRVSDNSNGTWHYEYAIHNFNSHRSARSFSVPVPPIITVSNIGFHDIDYHSGEPYDGTDWIGVHENGAVAWSTDSFAVNENANALRWGTLYNFRFDADAPPGSKVATLGLFRPGTPGDVVVPVPAPVVAVPLLSAWSLLVMCVILVAASQVILRLNAKCIA